MLEATTARNEEGQVLTLAELAAKSTANKAIRRAELMTRISGFERYTDAEGHQGVFITLTCPSRFQRYMIGLAQQARRWEIESERRVWTIERAPSAAWTGEVLMLVGAASDFC